MRTVAWETKIVLYTVLPLATIILQSGCSTAVLRYDQTEVPKARPWTSESFTNNADNFQLAIIGDRGGGASPLLGTYERAIDQLNWLQPEFVMSVGDDVEGYTTVQGEMDKQGRRV